jgi:serine/threonine-protein kinase RsbW
VRPVGALLVRHEPASAALVRHQLVDDLVRQQVASESIDEVALVATELVGNAVRHARPSASGTIDVSWDIDDSGVTLRVYDPSEEAPTPRTPSAEEASGRGLTIVATVSDAWGYQRCRNGKEVWARVPVRASSDAMG